MKNKKLIIATIAGVVGLSALGAVTYANFEEGERKGEGMFGIMMHHGDRVQKGGMGMMGQGGENDVAHAAVLAGDYSAFLAAIADAPFADKMTEEQFAKMTVRAQQEQSIQSAIENNDYATYLTAVQSVFAERSSESFFNDLVNKRLSAEKIKMAIETEDYDAYVEAVKGTEREGKLTEEQFAAMLTHKADKSSGGRGKNMHLGMKKSMQKDIGMNRPSNTTLQAAVIAGDYDAFVQAIAGTALEGKVSHAQFNTIVAKFTK